ncbi:MAG: hypothetical protein EZS28_048573, partial [Streblomastix strix]
MLKSEVEADERQAQINFKIQLDAQNALEEIDGKIIRDSDLAVKLEIQQIERFTNMQSNMLYIGDLEHDTNEDILRNFFEKKAPGVNINVKMCLDHLNPHKSLGYGYLNFDTQADAQKVLDDLNYSELKPNGRAFRLMWRQP